VFDLLGMALHRTLPSSACRSTPRSSPSDRRAVIHATTSSECAVLGAAGWRTGRPARDDLVPRPEPGGPEARFECGAGVLRPRPRVADSRLAARQPRRRDPGHRGRRRARGLAFCLASDGHAGSREHTLQLGFHVLLRAGASSAQPFRLTQANPSLLLRHGVPALADREPRAA